MAGGLVFLLCREIRKNQKVWGAPPASLSLSMGVGRLFGSNEGWSVFFWRRREPLSGLGCRPFICWLKGKKMGGEWSGAGEGERLWSAGNQEKKTHWWG